MWRVLYSLCLSSLRCDFFEVTPMRGVGSAEYLVRLPVREGDHILAERGYATPAGRITARVNTGALPLHTPDGAPFDLLAAVSGLLKHDDDSARAWLYGKLLVALLVEKLVDHARAVSPWGYGLAATQAP